MSDNIEFTTHLGCKVRMYDTPLGHPSDHLGPGKMLTLMTPDVRYTEVHLSPEDLEALFRQAKEEAWAEGQQYEANQAIQGWNGTPDDNPYKEA